MTAKPTTVLKTTVPREVFETLRAKNVNISALLCDLLTAHVASIAPPVLTEVTPSQWASCLEWVKSNHVKFRDYSGSRKNLTPQDRLAIAAWIDSQRWLVEGDTANEIVEPCDEVDNCAQGKHGEGCVSYALNPYDGGDS